ncbi:MAG: EAL domain-containing protein [Acidobacteria bacterium]|nr:MAG: EAL domain-containing protein [Acidobacteriota bacterium]
MSSSGVEVLPVGTAAEVAAGLIDELMPEIAARFTVTGAVGVVLVDTSALAEVERLYGEEAYRRSRRELDTQVLNALGGYLESGDVIATVDAGHDHLVVLLFRPRKDYLFYRETLPALARILSDVLEKNAGKIVFPYTDRAIELPVGHALTLRNPTLRPERSVRDAIDAARRDAHLGLAVRDREKKREFLNLLLAEQVQTVFEKILDLETLAVFGYEALTRGPWGTPWQSPAVLFEMAERTGMLFELDCLCRRSALRVAAGNLPAGRRLFLNCLPSAIHDPSFRTGTVQHTLDQCGLQPGDVVFEISERESVRNFSIFREARDYYKGLGFGIALDDTGSGYASLSSVIEMVPDFIKVDLSLIRGIDVDPNRRAMLEALQKVATQIGAKVIAEGIETEAELEAVRSLGVPYGQGYLFGRPGSLP